MLQTFTVPAGGRQIDTKANFFRYESAVAGGADESLRVRADGNDLGTYLPGDAIRLPIDAKRWEMTPVTPTATCIVRLGLGQITSDRLAGNVRVIDEITDRIALASSSASLAITAFAVTALVLPAQNERGCILRSFALAATAGAGGFANNRLVAAKSTPTSFALPTQQWVPAAVSNSTTVQIVETNTFVNKFLPPGWGLYHAWQISAVAATTNYLEIGHELL